MDESLRSHLIGLETALLRPEVRASRAQLDALLSDAFREIASTGRMFGKDEALSRLPTESGVSFHADRFAVETVGEGVALVSYRASRSCGGEVRASLRASLWRIEDGAWRMLFHQGTPLPQGDTMRTASHPDRA